jgi:hypothetical protein
MKTSKFTQIVTIVLGAFLIVYAANQFLHIIPTGYGDMQEFTKDFLDAVLPFLPFLYIFEILLGIVLILNKWTPFISIVLAPLSINFLIFNLVNGGWNIVPALFVAILNIILLYKYRERYMPLFV